MATDKIFTVRELSEIFGISRQAMRKHVDNLDQQYISKNSHGYKVITVSGALSIADKLDNKKAMERLSEVFKDEHQPDNISDSGVVRSLSDQLSEKDKQIEQLHQLLDQQQQLTLQANRQIESLQSSVSQLKIEYDQLEVQSTKKWWQFWK